MDDLSELMATYEAELRQVAEQHGGEVDVWRPEPAEVIQLLPGSNSGEALSPEDNEDGIWGELGVVIDADFEEIEPDDDNTLH